MAHSFTDDSVEDLHRTHGTRNRAEQDEGKSRHFAANGRAEPGRHIWSELVPYRQLVGSPVLGQLAARRIQLIIAVFPQIAAGVAEVVASCRDAGVRIAVWPMLADDDGRWASNRTATRFCDQTRRLLDRLDRARALPDELAIDLEPPIAQMRALLGGKVMGLRGPGRPAAATAELGALIADARDMRLGVSAAVAPMIALGSARAGNGWERLLGTPVAGLAFDRVSAMSYTSLMEGYSRGMLGRRDARALLWAAAGAAVHRFGARAGVSLGCVGAGALGDERSYRSAAELADDVAIVRAAGIDDIALFDLGGLLQRPPVHAWLDALDTPPAPLVPVVMSTRARLLLAGLSWLGR